MSKELIERLRYISSHAGSGSATNTVCEAAINAIESMQAENAALKSQRDMWESMFEEVRAERDALAAKLVPLEDYDAKHLLSLVPHYFGDTGDMYGMRVLRFIEAAHGIDAAKGGQHEDA